MTPIIESHRALWQAAPLEITHQNEEEYIQGY